MIRYAPRMVHFDRPPVVEVALALNTLPIPNLTSAHFGVFWDRELREKYPKVQELPAAPAVLDTPDGQPFTAPQFFIGPITSVRHWYLSPDETRLVQLQQDRLIVNWRRLGTDVYPRYDQLRADLDVIASAWTRYLASSGFPRLPVTQTEVTYVNHVPAVTDAGEPVPVTDVVSAVQLEWPQDAGAPESLQLEQRFVIEDGDKRLGRLSFQVAPLQLPGGPPLHALNLTFRGLGGESLNDAMQMLDIGHNQVINTFRDMTTATMHQQWGATDE